MPCRIAGEYGPVIPETERQLGQAQHVERFALAKAQGEDEIHRIQNQESDSRQRRREQRVAHPARASDHGSGTAAVNSFCRLARIASVGCDDDCILTTARLNSVANSL